MFVKFEMKLRSN